MLQFSMTEIPGLSFLFLGMPLFYSDLRHFFLSPFFLALQALGTILALVLFLPQEAFLRSCVALGVFLLFTGLWFLMQERLGYGDVLMVTIMAWAVDPISWYLVMVLACLLSFIFFGYIYIRKYDIMRVRLPFGSLLILSFTAVYLL